ncbi:hypothetical protein PCANC_14198 [Puccinia coronata f. sp. avenae]|uniref:Pectate lyase n=1 Tax=Puccinia coronata f. sp. avenae TaxID=200324 RepID=A0A2N5SYL5_9BASI|nr:hypothetical protein PCANC_14198 [Puccinia coronata f. sp. avenae]
MIAKCFVYLAGTVSASLAAPMNAADTIAHGTAPQGVIISQKAQALAPVTEIFNDGTETKGTARFCACVSPGGTMIEK